MDARYSWVLERLRRRSAPVHELGSSVKVAVTLAAGRIPAMAFSQHDRNLLWCNPRLGDEPGPNGEWGELEGGLGGDRLWFSPELAYHWDGVPDWKTFGNYKPPVATDPGTYEFGKRDAHSVTLHAGGELAAHRTDHRVTFEVDRTIALAEPPVSRDDPMMRGVDYVGVESSHTLRIAPANGMGVVALWHLVQVPAGTVLIVPTKSQANAAKPLSYALPGAWVEKSNHVMWRYAGDARAKLGLSAAAVTGRAAVLRELEPGRWCMLVREFPVCDTAKYCDHPFGVPRTDQVFQAWDGYGFGELEFHSTALSTADGPRELTESDRLWIFGGTAQAIRALATRLLGVNVDYVVEE